MNKDLLKLSNLSKEFLTANSKIKILKKINVKIAYGKIVALVGPSGSGKSTLLHLIGQLDTVTSGDIFFENVNYLMLMSKKKTI
jgi:ABC-type lipoprotein export system ATPase subunit